LRNEEKKHKKFINNLNRKKTKNREQKF
jgi:hypothetical protein